MFTRLLLPFAITGVLKKTVYSALNLRRLTQKWFCQRSTQRGVAVLLYYGSNAYQETKCQNCLYYKTLRRKSAVYAAPQFGNLKSTGYSQMAGADEKRRLGRIRNRRINSVHDERA